MSRSHFLLLLTALLPVCPLVRGDEESPQATEAEVARLIKQLGDDDFQRRQAAGERLEKLGPAAWEPLRHAAATSEDAEISVRSRELAARIARRLFAEVRGRRLPIVVSPMPFVPTRYKRSPS